MFEFLENPMYFSAIAIWSVFWKAFSLWIAANRRQRVWFIALLILNTLGILDIIYIVFFGRRSGQTVGEAMKDLVATSSAHRPTSSEPKQEK